MNDVVLDQKDKMLLNALQHNAKKTNQELAELLKLSPSATARRVQLLEKSGAIKRYRAELNSALLGKTMHVFISITLSSQDHPHLQAFERAIQQLQEVQDCFLLAGDADYMVRIVCEDMAAFERFHSRELTKLPYVKSIKTTFGMREVIQNRGIRIE